MGWLLDAEGYSLDERALRRKLIRCPSLVSGAEHDVWFDADADRVIKLTHSGYFDRKSPLEYIENILWGNELFGDDRRIEGVVTWDGCKRLVISQPFIPGGRANQREIETYYALLGFVYDREEGVFFRESDGLKVFDAVPDNVFILSWPRKNTVVVAPIDVWVVEGR